MDRDEYITRAIRLFPKVENIGINAKFRVKDRFPSGTLREIGDLKKNPLFDNLLNNLREAINKANSDSGDINLIWWRGKYYSDMEEVMKEMEMKREMCKTCEHRTDDCYIGVDEDK